MKINVYRRDSAAETEGCFDCFEVPAAPHWTVMQVLDYIAENFDSTLAYYRHSACCHGICGRCALKVNGKVSLACATEVGDAAELTLEPKNGKILRDLVTADQVRG